MGCPWFFLEVFHGFGGRFMGFISLGCFMVFLSGFLGVFLGFVFLC